MVRVPISVLVWVPVFAALWLKAQDEARRTVRTHARVDWDLLVAGWVLLGAGYLVGRLVP